MNILFVSSEVEDLAKTGGLADVAKALPIALSKLDQNVKIVTPFYRTTANADQAKTVFENLEVIAGDLRYYYSVKEINLHGVTVYAIDQGDFFDREGIYSDGYDAYADNGERFAFFSMAALHLAHVLQFKVDVVHCNDWHTALIPYFMKKHWHSDPYLSEAKSVYTVHNGAFQGVFNLEQVPFLLKSGVDHQYVHHGMVNWVKIAIQHADKLVAVSPSYAQELQTDLGSHHLGDLFRQRSADITGVLNGCDYSQWDPATDELLPSTYNADDMSGKAFCKATLQQQSHLPVDDSIPIIGMVCRITDQKGFFYLLPILENILHHNVQIVLCGTGDPQFVGQLQELSEKYRNKFYFLNDFSLRFAHLITAGSDFFLMPSLFEPCGLNQMYSLAYGTLPIVRAVGGLKDTIVDYEADPETCNGFVFHHPEPEDLLSCVLKALLFYYEYPEVFNTVKHRAIKTRFTWDAAAQQYLAVYNSMK
ncbi:glycogen synthase GlgA [Saccharobesus litoralis]|uniref:Glycogen synthase n=1 Tax=Saccharobesus litoralis TaxID=2172099 RepID=A0A2S0VR98_9ALTE|nr:glycogen synthase GlgA [Saccharobesus litoralis]AWB66733.1 glycogen synthase GlgA [Saccharobesus litoralis]